MMLSGCYGPSCAPQNSDNEVCLSYLGCHNKKLELVINSRNLFLTVLEARKSKIKVLADSVTKGPFPSLKTVSFHCYLV